MRIVGGTGIKNKRNPNNEIFLVSVPSVSISIDPDDFGILFVDRSGWE